MLKLEHLCKTFNAGTVNEKIALADLNLHLKEGEFLTVIGGNGAGKSTMLNAVAGTFPVDDGKILIDGNDVAHMPEHKRAAFIGRVFQDPMMGTAPTMQIDENLALAARRGQRRGLKWGISREEKELYFEKLKELGLGLEERMSAKAGLLSGGQRQALTLLMASLRKPKLLLLDEHTAALDPAAAEKILSMTKKVVSENALTCLMITHDMQSALDLGSRTLMLDRGRIIYDVSGEERKHLTVPDLLEKFKAASGRAMNNDRMLLV